MSNEVHFLLPVNSSKSERGLEATMARTVDLPVPVTTVWNPMLCPEALLPWLAWALSVDDWDSLWPESIKRNLIAESISIHRIKGTVSAIRRVLRVLGVEAELSEWFDHGGIPHTFRLTAWANANLVSDSEVILSPSLYRALKRAVDAVKPVRSHYQFRTGARFDGALAIGSASSGTTYGRYLATTHPQISISQGTASLVSSAMMVSVVRARLEIA